MAYNLTIKFGNERNNGLPIVTQFVHQNRFVRAAERRFVDRADRRTVFDAFHADEIIRVLQF